MLETTAGESQGCIKLVVTAGLSLAQAARGLGVSAAAMSKILKRVNASVNEGNNVPAVLLQFRSATRSRN